MDVVRHNPSFIRPLVIRRRSYLDSLMCSFHLLPARIVVGDEAECPVIASFYIHPDTRAFDQEMRSPARFTVVIDRCRDVRPIT